MKLLRKVGATSQIFQIFIADSSSTTGDGLAGLAVGGTVPTAYYHRDTDTTATAISLVTMTVGTFTSSGFKEIDATHMKGWYQFCPPNAALASGASSVSFHLYGATNQAALPIEVDLDAQVDVTAWLGTAVTAVAAGIPDVNVKNVNNLVSSGNAAFGPVWDVVRASHTTSGTFGGDTVTPPTNFSSLGISAGGAINEVTLTDTLTTYTGNTVQTGDAFARLGVAGVGLTNLGDTRIANLDAAVSSRMATYTQPTGFLAATFPSGTVANTTNITAGTITTVTNLTNAPTAGDLTATMKTSVTTAATAATPTAAAVTGNVGGNVTGSIGSLGATAKTDVSTAVLTTQMTESYAALHAAPTLAQYAFETRAILAEKSISGTTVTTKKIDGSTTAETYTINSSTAPTSVTRAS